MIMGLMVVAAIIFWAVPYTNAETVKLMGENKVIVFKIGDWNYYVENNQGNVKSVIG
jgi:hypothetical protein